MRHLDFDELWRNELFDYKDGDLLVIDDITRLNLSDYENTALDFIFTLFCAEGRMMLTVEEQEYRIEEGCLSVCLSARADNEQLHAQSERQNQGDCLCPSGYRPFALS